MGGMNLNARHMKYKATWSEWIPNVVLPSQFEITSVKAMYLATTPRADTDLEPMYRLEGTYDHLDCHVMHEEFFALRMIWLVSDVQMISAFKEQPVLGRCK